MLINVHSQQVAHELNVIAQKAYDNKEFLLLLDIYNYSGMDGVRHATDTSKYNRADMLTFTGKQALTINGWVTILSCLPIANSERFVITFSDRPDEAYILDSTGYNSDKRIYKVADKPTFEEPIKPKRGRPRKDKPSKSMKDLIDNAQSNLMTESDFPLPTKE